MIQPFLYLVIIGCVFFTNQLLAINANVTNPLPRVLTVYTHHSFAKEWNFDHYQLRSKFEKKCNCKLEIVGLDNGGTLLSRLKLEGKHSKADIILGLDYNLISEAEKTKLFSTINFDTDNLVLPIKWKNKYFLPFDYGYLTFIYNKNKIKEVPKSLEELVYKYPGKIIIADPRSSSVGLNFLLWMRSVFDDQSTNAWQTLSKKIVTVTKGWGESYGLFLKGEADMVLSYTTSPAYHMLAEQNYNYNSISFEDGNYLQIEVAGILKNSPNPDLADMFLEFLISKDFQITMLTQHYMYPVIDLQNEIPNVYKTIKIPENVLFMDSMDIHNNKKYWILEWLSAITKN
jgi:thiamine transport system substrate-binding protein